MTGTPKATHIACLRKMVNDEPLCAYAVTLDAESTMTRPSTRRNVAAPRTM